MNNLEQKLKTAVSALEHRDPTLARELEDKIRPEANASVARDAEARPSRRMSEGLGRDSADRPTDRQRLRNPESIVLRTGRPVLAVKNDNPELAFRDTESEVWRSRLQKAKDQIHQAVLASGRVEVQHHPRFDWIGTAWLVREDIIVTNRHVASEFARLEGTQLTFRPGTLGRQMRASVDFLEEFGRSDERTFQVKQVLHIEGDSGPDMALLRVERSNADLAQPIALSKHIPIADQQVATIGYPAFDSRIPDLDLMEDIFGDVFDKKRLAPGQVIRMTGSDLEHDCSTLGGNSGSVVLDLESGEAVGLHFSGRFLLANFAVPAAVIQQRLNEVTKSGGRSTVSGAGVAPLSGDVEPSTSSGEPQLSVATPVDITVDSGDPAGDDQAEDDELILTEARPEDYTDRGGYSATFLGDNRQVPVPVVQRNPEQVLQFRFGGRTRTLLDYEHFSVMMGRSRRMCIFSAVNIDGTEPRKGKRPGWRTDPRIPAAAQLVNGPYGNAPRFARGHMTRREDPMWGSIEVAARGNADSMHLTNAVPQMQPFNGGIWLGLEEFALQNARQDDMRICVFTGPVFRTDDPTRFGVKIPVTFWKVIAFIHDDTKKLTATGYTMSQKSFLQEQEFVFGAHLTTQTSLAAIQNMSGLSFGDLIQRDPLIAEGPEAPPRPLTDFREIRFV